MHGTNCNPACLFNRQVTEQQAKARTGRSRTGLQLGLWSSIVYIVFPSVTDLVRTHLFATTLAQTIWLHDAVCQTTRDLASCAIGDDLGGMTNALLIFPLLGIGTGWLGGKLGIQKRRARSQRSGGGNDLSTAALDPALCRLVRRALAHGRPWAFLVRMIARMIRPASWS